MINRDNPSIRRLLAKCILYHNYKYRKDEPVSKIIYDNRSDKKPTTLKNLHEHLLSL
jgi:hypothetical protein